MSWYRKNPVFAVALTLCAMAALGELWCIYDRWAASRTAAAKVVQKQAELAAMREVQPPPNRENAAAIEADLERAQRTLAVMQAELKGQGPALERMRAAKVPTARTDAYFDLATFVERMRETARRHEVDVRPEAARFGFAAYANEGPDAERIEPVFQQRQIAQFLLEALFEARPRALLAVKREPPLTRKQKEERVAAVRAAAEGGVAPEPEEAPDIPEGSDFFLVEPRVSARVPGFVDTMGFRLVFTGQTATLRTFINRLAEFELPIIAREIEVEPATTEETVATPAVEDVAGGPGEVGTVPSATPDEPIRPPVAAKKAPGPAAKKAAPRITVTPIVPRAWSKFTVTVEYIDPVPPATNPAEAPAEAAPSGS